MAYAAKKAVGLLLDTIKEGAREQVQLNNFQALTGSAKAGTALFNYAGEYAKKSALDRVNMEKAVTGFLPYTKDINQIEQLIKLSERLYAKDPTQGAEGAVFALKEILTGQTQSIKDQFNMNGILGEKIRKLSNSGDIAGTIKYLDETFNKFGATQEIVDKNFSSLMVQTNMFTTNFKAAMADEANPAVQNLSLIMQRLNDDMDAGKFQPFFNVIANGAAAIGNGMARVAQNANWLVPAIGGAVSAIVVFNTAMSLAKDISLLTGATLKAVAGNWIGAATLIAGAATTIGLAVSLTKQNDEIKKTADNLSKAKKDYNSSLKNETISKNNPLPTELSNKAPIKVKGEVEIEKESQKYFFDIAAQKAIAMFNMQQVTPQVTIQNQNISKETDASEVTRIITDAVTGASVTQAQGVYS